jgi:hypothetical protein
MTADLLLIRILKVSELFGTVLRAVSEDIDKGVIIKDGDNG